MMMEWGGVERHGDGQRKGEAKLGRVKKVKLGLMNTHVVWRMDSRQELVPHWFRRVLQKEEQSVDLSQKWKLNETLASYRGISPPTIWCDSGLGSFACEAN